MSFSGQSGHFSNKLDPLIYDLNAYDINLNIFQMKSSFFTKKTKNRLE